MTEETIQQKILDIFQKERKNPNADYNPSHFLDFLKDPPYTKNMIQNSFVGVRKYHRFMDKLELEFGICFSVSDLDRHYSVAKLAKKVLQRIKKGKGNKMILQHRLKEKENYNIEIFLLAVAILLFLWLGLHWITILVAMFCGIGIYWILSSKVCTKKHDKLMNERLKYKVHSSEAAYVEFQKQVREKVSKISGIEAMTVNERLAAIDVMDAFNIYKKLDKKYAAFILKALQVDNSSISKILKLKNE